MAPIHIDRVCAANQQGKKMYKSRVKIAYSKAGIFKTKQILATKATLFTNGSSGMSHDEFLATFPLKFNAFHIQTRKIRGIVADKMRKIYASGQNFSPQAQVY